MELKNTTMISFYQLLGRVFYAAAQADKVIRPEEVSQLKRMVEEVWLDADHTFDEFNSDSAYQIEIVFNHLLNNDIVVENVIDELESFKKIHSILFTASVIELIMQTASKIVSSFAKRNKSELVFLSQLRNALTK